MSTRDASINIVALLKVDVLKKIATDCSSRNGVAIHIDAGELRDCTFNRHESLAQILVDSKFFR